MARYSIKNVKGILEVVETIEDKLLFQAPILAVTTALKALETATSLLPHAGIDLYYITPDYQRSLIRFTQFRGRKPIVRLMCNEVPYDYITNQLIRFLQQTSTS